MHPFIIFAEMLQLGNCAVATSQNVNRKRRLNAAQDHSKRNNNLSSSAVSSANGQGMAHRWDYAVYGWLAESCKRITASLGRFKNEFTEDCFARLSVYLNHIRGANADMEGMGRGECEASAETEFADGGAKYSNLAQRREIADELPTFIKFLKALVAKMEQGRSFDFNNPAGMKRYVTPVWLKRVQEADAASGDRLSYWDAPIEDARGRFKDSITRQFQRMYSEANTIKPNSEQGDEYCYIMLVGFNNNNRHYLHNYILELADLFWDYIQFIYSMHEQRGAVLAAYKNCCAEYERHHTGMPGKEVWRSCIEECISELFAEQEAAFATFLNKVEQRRSILSCM
ncbi:hypothetical protein PAPHI01_1197 [Pancytospora philotis]|nr:hypothetical protein PAPHI01_1197 [Pancytospora philotis]